MSQKFIAKMTGYKATNADMTCKDHQYELGKWYEVETIDMCKTGFHFCMSPSGVYAYYNHAGVRVFECEAEQILELPVEAGADFKLVAKRIRLTREITPGSKEPGNDGKYNTGDSNTGDWNTGDWNTGHRNTGHRNTGHSNTGHRNTGDSNTGNSNTGHRNTGDSNTGDWNTGDKCSGFFCAKEPKVISFDEQTDLTYKEYLEKFPQAYELGELLIWPEKISFKKFSDLPGITPEKLATLHKNHLEARKKA